MQREGIYIYLVYMTCLTFLNYELFKNVLTDFFFFFLGGGGGSKRKVRRRRDNFFNCMILFA